MKPNNIIWIILTTIFLVSIACSINPSIGQKVDQIKNTVESASTEINQNQEWIQTARAIATDIGDNSYIETAQAVATNIGDTDLLQTVQAIITTEPQELMETFQSITTDQSPSIIKTAAAIATQGISFSGVVPQDIPIVEGEKKHYYASNENISYVTLQSYNDVKHFYLIEMKNNGWKINEEKSLEIGIALIYVFEKSDRLVTLSISQNSNTKSTIVLINIEPK